MYVNYGRDLRVLLRHPVCAQLVLIYLPSNLCNMITHNFQGSDFEVHQGAVVAEAVDHERVLHEPDHGGLACHLLHPGTVGIGLQILVGDCLDQDPTWKIWFPIQNLR